MLQDSDGFVRLPNERLVYTSPPRTSLALTPPSSYKGIETLSIQSSAGCIHITNQRVGLQRQLFYNAKADNIPSLDCLPPLTKKPRLPVLLFPTSEHPRLPCLGAIFRSQCVDSFDTASVRRRHFSIVARRAIESDIQGGRSI